MIARMIANDCWLCQAYSVAKAAADSVESVQSTTMHDTRRDLFNRSNHLVFVSFAMPPKSFVPVAIAHGVTPTTVRHSKILVAEAAWHAQESRAEAVLKGEHPVVLVRRHWDETSVYVSRQVLASKFASELEHAM